MVLSSSGSQLCFHEQRRSGVGFGFADQGFELYAEAAQNNELILNRHAVHSHSSSPVTSSRGGTYFCRAPRAATCPGSLLSWQKVHCITPFFSFRMASAW